MPDACTIREITTTTLDPHATDEDSGFHLLCAMPPTYVPERAPVLLARSWVEVAMWVKRRSHFSLSISEGNAEGFNAPNANI